MFRVSVPDRLLVVRWAPSTYLPCVVSAIYDALARAPVADVLRSYDRIAHRPIVITVVPRVVRRA